MSPHRKRYLPTTSTAVWTAQWLFVVTVSFIALICALGGPYLFGHKIQPGQVAERDYVARQKALVTDVAKTEDAQRKAREMMVPVFRRDARQQQEITDSFNAKLAAIEKLRKDEKLAGTDALERDLVAMVPESDAPSWRADMERSLQRFLIAVPLFPQAGQQWNTLVEEFLPEKMPPELRRKSALLIDSTLKPDMVVDKEKTAERAKELAAQTQPITKQIETGTLVIKQGRHLDAQDVDLLKQMGITHTQDIGNLLGIAAALLAAFCLFGLYLFTFESEYFYSPSAIALMATVCVTTSGIAATVGHEYPQFIPLPATALVLVVVFGRRVSAALALLVLLFLHVCGLVDGPHLVALGAASMVALSTNITHRKELMLTGVLIGVVQAIGYFAAVMFGHMPDSALGVGKELVQNLLGGLSSSIVAIGSLPFLEIMFGILTPFRVAELSEPDQPLLRQLEENAPGTYQHSLAVANLAEAGAKSIGADINLVRAGAMYHDIGKMVTPRFFIENQLGDKNPHDEIAPEESRAKVLAHVTNGVELARKYALPRQIEAFIPEHQGTTIMAYFYHKACVRDGAENVKEVDYRYPGPKPQTRETAIVMLADVSEAVTHSMRDPTQEEVEAAMTNVFKNRWDDGQFSESGLTADEMEKVKQAFVRVWRTLHHERLKYPSTTTGKMAVPPPRTTA